MSSISANALARHSGLSHSTQSTNWNTRYSRPFRYPKSTGYRTTTPEQSEQTEQFTAGAHPGVRTDHRNSGARSSQVGGHCE
jgi:hypothetical protein